MYILVDLLVDLSLSGGGGGGGGAGGSLEPREPPPGYGLVTQVNFVQFVICKVVTGKLFMVFRCMMIYIATIKRYFLSLVI